ncbi:MAG TPA: hypothetical protein VH480_21005 [Streptosporangiaceae bacterium]
MVAAVYAGRLAINRAGVRADATEPGRAFGFFMLAAGSNVLAADDHLAAASVLLCDRRDAQVLGFMGASAISVLPGRRSCCHPAR